MLCNALPSCPVGRNRQDDRSALSHVPANNDPAVAELDQILWPAAGFDRATMNQKSSPLSRTRSVSMALIRDRRRCLPAIFVANWTMKNGPAELLSLTSFFKPLATTKSPAGKRASEEDKHDPESGAGQEDTHEGFR